MLLPRIETPVEAGLEDEIFKMRVTEQIFAGVAAFNTAMRLQGKRVRAGYPEDVEITPTQTKEE